jgi:3-oxoacyl-[acyl-carrier-protein] synthase-1
MKGYGNACDAYHQTASSPEGLGACLSMKLALESAGLKPEEIDYINAHGTGTKNNDLSEGAAVERIFPSGVPAISSTKPFTGHTLGAAGAIEAVLSILALQHGLIYPNLNFARQMNELNFSPDTLLRTGANIHHIMSNSFGFGGNNSTLILSRPA